jgi:polar amino acid transport system substrate-binding protein
VDLATELARELAVPVELVTFEAAGRVTDALASGAWDVAFLAVDPVRGREIAYSAPYVVIEGAYAVAQGSPILANADVDRPGVRVVVARGSAYDLYLTRALRLATLVRVPTSQQVTDTMLAQRLEVAAGVRQQLEADRRRHPSLRLLEGRFMVIEQAIGTPVGRTKGARYLTDFAERMKASGFVAQALSRHGIEGAAVAPPR